MSIAALAELRYRPSDAWLAAYVAETQRRLPVLRNQVQQAVPCSHFPCPLSLPFCPPLVSQAHNLPGRS